MFSLNIEVKEKKQITHDVILLSFNVPDEFNFQAGQFVSLVMEKDGLKRPRSYSILNPPTQKGQLDICIKIVQGGFASEIFEKTKVGDKFLMRGPLGHFVFQEDDSEEYWFIASGTGMAPFYSMLKEYLPKLPLKKFSLIISNKKQEDLLFYEELQQMEKDYHNFKCINTLTREEWSGAQGRVQEHLPDNLENKTFYICGVKPLVDGTTEELLRRGVDKKKIKLERYS